MGTRKSYYMQLKPHVNGFVTHYRSDFLVHDRAYFRKHPTGAFLYAIRPTGTDICNLEGWDEDWPEKPVNESSSLGENRVVHDKESQRAFARTWMTTYNKRFFHGVDGVVNEITKERAIAIIDAL